jgi:hypothetical protein
MWAVCSRARCNRYELSVIWQNGIAEEKQLLEKVGEIRCNWRSDKWERSITDVVTVVKHRETAGKWKKVIRYNRIPL